jgi:hypothetical protein
MQLLVLSLINAAWNPDEVETDLSYLDLVPSRSRSGAYLWERDNWAGSVINTCKLMEELTASSHGPVMDNYIKGCPLDKCMSYGRCVNLYFTSVTYFFTFTFFFFSFRLFEISVF